MFKSLTPALSIITAIVLFVFFTQPQYEKIKALGVEIDDYQETIQKYTEFNAKLRELMATKDGIKVDDQAKLDMMIPKEIDDARLLVDLEAMAKKHELLFGNIATDAGTRGVGDTSSKNASDKIVAHSVSFEVIGTYDQFKELLKEIESSLTFMEVTKISLTAASTEFQQYALTVETYALPKSN